MQHHHPAAQRSGTAAPGKRNTINMEAYQAYYNTNEAASGNAANILSQSNPKFSPNGQPISEQEFNSNAASPKNAYPKNIIGGTTNTAAGAAGENGSQTGPNGTNIINNIMHINHSGANINITSAPNAQNNFFFNVNTDKKNAAAAAAAQANQASSPNAAATTAAAGAKSAGGAGAVSPTGGTNPNI